MGSAAPRFAEARAEWFEWKASTKGVAVARARRFVFRDGPPEIVGEFVENCVADTLSSDVVIEGVMNANTEISHGDPFKAEARISRSIVTQPELRCGGREPTRR